MQGQKNKGKYDLGKALETFHITFSNIGPAASGSYSLTGSVLLFTFIGWLIDQNTALIPFATLIGALLGLIIGFYLLIKIINTK